MHSPYIHLIRIVLGKAGLTFIGAFILHGEWESIPFAMDITFARYYENNGFGVDCGTEEDKRCVNANR